jgi:GcrA cell cycle regulator
MAWDEIRIATLKGMWNEGMPSRTIAAKLGITKNAVLGKAHRLGLEMHIDANPRRATLGVETRTLRPRHPPRWDDDLETQLKTLWGAGLTQREIGAKLGFSGPAVCHKAARLGLSSRLRVQRATPQMRPRPRSEPVAEIVDMEIPLEQRKTLLDLGSNDCRFPIGDPTKGFWCNEEFFFCGGPTDGGPYCAGHAVRVRYTRPASATLHQQPFYQRPGAGPNQKPALPGLGAGGP